MRQSRAREQFDGATARMSHKRPQKLVQGDHVIRRQNGQRNPGKPSGRMDGSVVAGASRSAVMSGAEDFIALPGHAAYHPLWAKSGAHQRVIGTLAMNLHSSGSAHASGSADMTVRRGEKSWNYIYVALGFVLTFEGTIITMIPLRFPFNVLLYILMMINTSALFLLSGWFQNKLLGWKAGYEGRPW
jgi:hypothetical protein